MLKCENRKRFCRISTENRGKGDKRGNMSKNVRTKEVDALFDAVLSLKDREECYLFFGDVCTINELLSLSQRFEVAKMLQDGKNLSGDCRENRRIHRYHQPGKPFSELRKRWLCNGL